MQRFKEEETRKTITLCLKVNLLSDRGIRGEFYTPYRNSDLKAQGKYGNHMHVCSPRKVQEKLFPPTSVQFCQKSQFEDQFALCLIGTYFKVCLQTSNKQDNFRGLYPPLKNPFTNITFNTSVIGYW